MGESHGLRNPAVSTEIVWRSAGSPEMLPGVKVAARVALYFVLLVMTTIAIHLHRDKILSERITAEEGMWMLLSLRDGVRYRSYLSEKLTPESDISWMADGIPPEWVALAQARAPRFLRVEEVREKSRSNPVEVIKVESKGISQEGHRLFGVVRVRYWWEDGRWMKRFLGDYYRLAVVKVDGSWEPVPIPPVAIP